MIEGKRKWWNESYTNQKRSPPTTITPSLRRVMIPVWELRPFVLIVIYEGHITKIRAVCVHCLPYHKERNVFYRLQFYDPRLVQHSLLAIICINSCRSTFRLIAANFSSKTVSFLTSTKGTLHVLGGTFTNTNTRPNYWPFLWPR